MTDKPNPLYHESKGDGPHNALIEFDGMNRFTGDSNSFLMCDRKIAKLEGATLRFSSERDICDMKVYHPTEKDCDDDTCSIAVYEFYNLHLDSTYWGRFVFKGLLTSIRRHEEEPVVDDRNYYPYIPEPRNQDSLPLPITLTLWSPREED